MVPFKMFKLKISCLKLEVFILFKKLDLVIKEVFIFTLVLRIIFFLIIELKFFFFICTAVIDANLIYCKENKIKIRKIKNLYKI